MEDENDAVILTPNKLPVANCQSTPTEIHPETEVDYRLQNDNAFIQQEAPSSSTTQQNKSADTDKLNQAKFTTNGEKVALNQLLE